MDPSIIHNSGTDAVGGVTGKIFYNELHCPFILYIIFPVTPPTASISQLLKIYYPYCPLSLFFIINNSGTDAVMIERQML